MGRRAGLPSWSPQGVRVRVPPFFGAAPHLTRGPPQLLRPMQPELVGAAHARPARTVAGRGLAGVVAGIELGARAGAARVPWRGRGHHRGRAPASGRSWAPWSRAGDHRGVPRGPLLGFPLPQDRRCIITDRHSRGAVVAFRIPLPTAPDRDGRLAVELDVCPRRAVDLAPT
jgi:hypothetical protein